MTKEVFHQPELFIPDPDVPGALTANPETIVITTTAGRAYAMARIAASDSLALEAVEVPQKTERFPGEGLLLEMRFERDDNNPNRSPDPEDLERIRSVFAPKVIRPTVAEQNANERAHIAKARRQRRGR